jgi:Zn-finger nucleic acid-binding protein
MIWYVVVRDCCTSGNCVTCHGAWTGKGSKRIEHARYRSDKQYPTPSTKEGLQRYEYLSGEEHARYVAENFKLYDAEVVTQTEEVA